MHLVHMAEDPPVVRDDALERLVQLLLALLLVELHEDLLQARAASASRPARGRPVTYEVEAVQPLLDLEPVRPLRALVRGVQVLQDEHLDEAVELPL